MATGGYQQQFSGGSFPVHLTDDPEFAIGEHVETDAEGGLYACRDCHRRITRNSNNHNEYGHDTSCAHHQFASVTTGGVQ